MSPHIYSVGRRDGLYVALFEKDVATAVQSFHTFCSERWVQVLSWEIHLSGSEILEEEGEEGKGVAVGML